MLVKAAKRSAKQKFYSPKLLQTAALQRKSAVFVGVELFLCYTHSMRILITLAIITALQGCAVYSIGSGVAYFATDKTLTDHVSSTLVNANCNAVHVVTKGYYYCETRDIAKTYNRQYP